MLDSMLPLILILLAVYLWQNALRARERARAFAHELCARAGVQLLDQTVALRRLRIERVPGFGLQLRRCYGFELSTMGADRLHGSLDLRDGELLAYQLPPAQNAAAVSVEASRGGNVIELRPSRTPH